MLVRLVPKASAALLLAAALAPTPTSALLFSDYGAIEGTVMNAEGAPLANICVYASGEQWSELSYTDDAGRYEVTGLDPGSYRVAFWDCSGEQAYRDEYYDDERYWEDADLVEVRRRETTRGIDAVLERMAFVRGTVRNGSGEPLVDICVWVGKLEEDGSAIGPVIETGADGAYAAAVEGDNDYKVWFFDCSGSGYAEEWYDDHPDFDSADVIHVATSELREGIDAVLTTGGSIAGAVTDESGQPLNGVCVAAETSGSGWLNGLGYTGDDGSYRVDRLHPGEQRLLFIDCRQPAVYAYEWYADRPDFPSADAVGVQDGETSQIDASLAPGGRVAGRITDPNGKPLAEMCVTAFDASGHWVGFGTSDGSGQYVVGGLRTGRYRVEFRDCYEGGFLAEWWNDRPDFDSAHEIAVEAPATTGGIDAALAFAASCTDDADGDGLSDCEEAARGTRAYDPDSDHDGFGDGFEVYGGSCAGIQFGGGSDPMNPLSTPVLDATRVNPGPLPGLLPPLCNSPIGGREVAPADGTPSSVGGSSRLTLLRSSP